MAQNVVAYDFNLEAGEISNRRVVIDYAADPALGVWRDVPRGLLTLVTVSRWNVHR